MSIFSFSARSLAIIIALAIMLSSSIVYAAVTISTSQQKIRTMKAVIAGSDISTASLYPGSPNTRYLVLDDIPMNVEIVSAHVRVSEPFTRPNSAEASVVVSAAISDTNLGAQLTSAISLLQNGTAINPVDTFYMFPEVREAIVLIDGSGTDPVDISGGSMTVYINYLVH